MDDRAQEIGVDRNAYPRGGDIAILCEGDVVGYEAKLLKSWADRTLKDGPLVDVWACGTCTAIFGMSDAIGRTIPVVVIEDKDFRTTDEVKKDCEHQKNSRERRGAVMRAWKAWRRNEIENYFLDFDVLLPVVTKAFACTEDEVEKAVEDALKSLVVLQAIDYCVYRARRVWEESDPPVMHLLKNIRKRPSWEGSGLVGPNHSVVRRRLEENAGTWQKQFQTDGRLGEPLAGVELLAEFDQRYGEWSAVTLDSSFWRTEWAGKEVLKGVRQLLSKRHGWWNADDGVREHIDWVNMSRKDADAVDRKIERELLPRLVERFLVVLADAPEKGVHEEFAELEQVLRA